MLKSLKFALAIALVATPLAAQEFGLGRLATADEVAAWNTDVRPDGQGLPTGQGSVLEGEEIFAEACAVCHGDFGEGKDRWPVLAGGHGSLTDERPVKTVGSYWPYLSTVWDYVNRAMPFGNASSLSNDDVYALTAYILYVNDVVDEEEFVLSDANFLETRLPNEANFFADDRASSPVWAKREVCMADCKDTVEITARAAVVDVTPEETAAAAAEVVQAEAAVVEAPVEAMFDVELAAQGEKIFKKCKACHRVGDGAKNGVGPTLNGVYQREAGVVEKFKYSKSLLTAAADGLVWNDENLDTFLTKPKSLVAKTKMSFAGLKKEGDRLAIIEYLKSVSQ